MALSRELLFCCAVPLDARFYARLNRAPGFQRNQFVKIRILFSGGGSWKYEISLLVSGRRIDSLDEPLISFLGFCRRERRLFQQ